MPNINPLNITDYNRDDDALQRFWLFGILVAGKNADWASRCLGDLLRPAAVRGILPFEYLRERETDLHNMLVVNRIGQYARITRAIRESLDLDLRTATVEQLQVHGVGPKTSRFFVLHSRPGARVAVLDVHILRWLRSKCCDHGRPIPEHTPAEPLYSKLEALALMFMEDTFPGLSPAQADLLLWSTMSGRVGTPMDVVRGN